MGHSSIDLDSEVEIKFRPQFDQPPDLIQRERNEFLTAKARVNAHHEHVMDHRQDFDQKIDPGGRIDDHGRFHAVLGDQLQGAVQVAARFVVNGDPIGARPLRILR